MRQKTEQPQKKTEKELKRNITIVAAVITNESIVFRNIIYVNTAIILMMNIIAVTIS